MGSRAESLLRRSDELGEAPILDSAIDATAAGLRQDGANLPTGDESGEGLGRYMATSCPTYCGYPVNGVVEWCSPGCREWGVWGREA